jgi:serine/threonine protein kinase
MTIEDRQTDIDPEARKNSTAAIGNAVRSVPAPTIPSPAPAISEVTAPAIAFSVGSLPVSGGELDQCAIGSVIVGRYLIEKKLGQGGMGVVYLGRDRRLMDKRVVVKILLGEFVGNEWTIRKFLQEKEALTRANHPGIVGILDAGELPGGQPFLVMEYIDGVTLHDAITPGGVDLKRAGNLIRQIGSALAAAHSNGIYHRDLKPENIMLQCLSGGEEQVRIIDFGIAKVHNSLVSEHTVAGRFGTYVYMSPEQFRVEEITVASDVYSMGAIAYEVVTGHAPFNPKSFKHLGDMYSAGVQVPPRELRRELPERAQKLILKALSQRPQDRFQNAVEFGDALAQALIENRKVRERTVSWKGVLKRRQVRASSPRDSPGQATSSKTSRLQESSPEATLGPASSVDATVPLAISDQAALRQASSGRATVRQPSLRQLSFGQGSLRRVGLPVAVVVVAALAVVSLAGLIAPVIWGGPKKPDNKGSFESPMAAIPGAANTALPVVPRNSLTYYLTVQKGSGGQNNEGVESSAAETFESGDRFRLNVLAAKPGYLYVLNEGEAANGTKSLTMIYPTPKVDENSQKLEGGQQVQTDWNQFGGKPGIEQFWIIWSVEPLEQFEAARDAAFRVRNRGRISDAVVVNRVREFLTASEKSESEPGTDNANNRTVIRGNANLLVKLLELNHR